MSDPNDNEYDLCNPLDDLCPDCGGDGWGIVGNDFQCDDAINGPYDGDIIRCPNCRGSGNLKDCQYM